MPCDLRFSKYPAALDISSSSAVSVISRPKSPELRLFSLTKSKINFIDEDGWKKDPLFNEYSKYKKDVIGGAKFPPIIITHPNVLKDYTKIKNIGV